MGVRQLETLMKKDVPGGIVPISLIVECKRFKIKNNKKPIIVIDFMGLVSVVSRNIEEMLCGGRFNKYQQELENLFQRLSQYAILVFFKDGPIVDQKLSTWIKRHSEKYHDYLKAMEIVINGGSFLSVQEYFQSHHDDVPRITTQNDLMEHIARKHGEFIETFTRECDSEIARYAYENMDVIAVLGNDTDFLIFPGHWRYFSLKDIDVKTLDTIEFSRTALRSFLNLNDQQLVILSTLNGNDIIKYDQVKESFHVQLHPFKHKFANERFPWLAQYARQISQSPKNMISNIQKLLQCVSTDKIKESIEMYNPVFNLEEETNELFQLCRDKSYSFTYSILLKKPKTATSVYVDLRLHPNMYEATINLFKKQIGLILNNESQNNFKYELIMKRNHTEDYRSHFIEPIFPGDIPPFIELLQRSEFREHDESRFKLLKWMIGSLRLKNFDLSLIPSTYLQDILTLSFLRYYKLIEAFEADLILLSIKHVETKTIPQDLRIPSQINENAFRASFIYGKFFIGIARSFQLIGLNDISKQINFDGLLFHSLYSKYMNYKFDILQLLGDDVKAYRIYK